MPDSPTLLAPYRVLDLTDTCGQLGARMLADLGADVIKIEPPAGSPARRLGPYLRDESRSERSLSWFFYNANKRGITLDIHTEAGRGLLRQLVYRTDAMFESFAPGELDALDIGYEALSAVNPQLVMASITPFGPIGPYAHYTASDIVTWAMGGRLVLDGDADRAPVRISVPQAYEHAGAHAAMGVMTALYARPALGRGQHVDVSVQATVAWTLMNAPTWWDLLHENMARGGAVRPHPRASSADGLPHRQIWPCKDGYVYYLTQGGAQAGAAASTRRLVERMDRDGLADGLLEIDWIEFDYRVVDDALFHHVTGAIARFFLTKTKAELTEIAVVEDIRIAPLNTVQEILADEQLEARDFWRRMDHPELGESITYPGQTVKISQAPWTLRRRAPLLGEHNLEVYGDLGLTADDLRGLRGARVI